MDAEEDAEDAKEYNALHKSIDEREREWQIEGDLFSPWDLQADDEHCDQAPLEEEA